ncbi:MAG: hypothetical protein KatS3mg027_0880 [Bacteroidia bacterium]|nr:MAG: hypothetical protein KatS3mg027_0880 [Bacteroidia bacterium]
MWRKTNLIIGLKKYQHIYFNFLDSTALERWGKNLLLKKCIDKYSDFAFNYVQFKNKNILIIKEWKDTMLLKSTQPNVIIWCIKKMPSKSLIPESTKKVYCVNGKVINENEKVLVMKNGQYIEFE